MDNANEPSSTTESYSEMAADQQREREAEEGVEALICDAYMPARSWSSMTEGPPLTPPLQRAMRWPVHQQRRKH